MNFHARNLTKFLHFILDNKANNVPDYDLPATYTPENWQEFRENYTTSTVTTSTTATSNAHIKSPEEPKLHEIAEDATIGNKETEPAADDKDQEPTARNNSNTRTATMPDNNVPDPYLTATYTREHWQAYCETYHTPTLPPPFQSSNSNVDPNNNAVIVLAEKINCNNNAVQWSRASDRSIS